MKFTTLHDTVHYLQLIHDKTRSSGIKFDNHIDRTHEEEICQFVHEWLLGIALSDSPLLGFVDRFDQWCAVWCTGPDMFHSCARHQRFLNNWVQVIKENLQKKHFASACWLNYTLMLMGEFNQKVFAFGQTETQKCVVSMSNVCWPSLIPRSILIDQTCGTLHFPIQSIVVQYSTISDKYEQVCNQLLD